MAKKDEGKVSVKLAYGTRVSGVDYEAGDSVDVYPEEKDHLTAYGYAEEETKTSSKDSK